MNIFEQLDNLVKKAEIIKESKKYDELPIDPSMSTEGQGREYIRDYFKKELMKGPEGSEDDDDSDDSRIMPIDPTPPPPPFHIKRPKEGGGKKSKDWETATVEWDGDEFLKRLEIEAEELEKEKDFDSSKFDDEYDDFSEDPETRGPGGGGGDDDLSFDEDEKEGESGDDGGDDGSGGGSSKKDPFKKDDDDDEYEETGGGGDGTDGEDGDDTDEEGGDSTDGGTGGGKDGEDGEDGEGTDGGGMTGGKDGKKGKGGKKGGWKSGVGEGTDDIDEEGEDGEDGEGGKSGKGEKKEDGKKGKGRTGDGEDEDGEGGDGTDEGGEGGSGGKSIDEELEETIKDALEAMAEANEEEKEELSELIDMLKDENTDSEDIEAKEKEFDDMKEHGKERFDKLKSLVGKLEKAPTREEIEKEMKAAELSEEEKKELVSETVKSATIPVGPKDSELEGLKKEAMKELDRKCKDGSRLASSILYHSLKTPKIDNTDWDIILDKVLAKKSKHSDVVSSKSTTKKVILGDKNHLWRDVRYGYKKVKKGVDKKSIYCFVDYSGSVKSRPGLIMTFLGKILELTERLTYSDLCVYTFADNLSIPRVITHKMLNEEGYEKVLTDTINYFNLEENGVGGSIEDFALVAYEINKIKRDDKQAVFFIFGDGYWTFYGNRNPPTRLKEISSAYLGDIIPFIFYDDASELKFTLGKEIALLKDVVGITDVIVTKASKMKE